MRNLNSRDAMVDGISIRVRVRRAACTSKLEYGEPQDMVCTIVNWEIGGGSKRSKAVSPQRRGFAYQFRSSSSKNDSVSCGKVGPTLFFQARTVPGNTLEACCSLQSVSSYDSLDPSIASENLADKELTTPDVSQRFTSSTVTYQHRNGRNHNNLKSSDHNNVNKRKKTYSLPCSSIKTVEKVSSLFRGYQLFFVTATRGSYELEFENKNGQDIMMAFLQATLPPHSFVNFESGGSKSVDASDTASYLSTLDVEKLTERLAERESEETMSERLKRSVGLMMSSIEEMSSNFCGNVCCHGQLMGASVAPYSPPEEIRDPPSPIHNRTTIQFHCKEPLMEMAEEKSMQGSVASVISESPDMGEKRLYLRDYKLPSGLSVEMPE